MSERQTSGAHPKKLFWISWLGILPQLDNFEFDLMYVTIVEPTLCIQKMCKHNTNTNKRFTPGSSKNNFKVEPQMVPNYQKDHPQPNHESLPRDYTIEVLMWSGRPMTASRLRMPPWARLRKLRHPEVQLWGTELIQRHPQWPKCKNWIGRALEPHPHRTCCFSKKMCGRSLGLPWGAPQDSYYVYIHVKDMF